MEHIHKSKIKISIMLAYTDYNRHKDYIIVVQEFFTKVKNSYCERGAIPLALPKLYPATTTGIPWFPAAIEAVFLYITDTS
jgi:hypothetical protein